MEAFIKINLACLSMKYASKHKNSLNSFFRLYPAIKNDTRENFNHANTVKYKCLLLFQLVGFDLSSAHLLIKLKVVNQKSVKPLSLLF